MAPRPREFVLCLLCAGALCAPPAAVAQSAGGSRAPTEYSIEELLEVKVYSASRFEQKRSEAPGAVTVIGAADIRAYGYRTLADILRSVRGLYVNYDRNYSYVGARGFGRLGDYNGRVLLLLDGHRLNDPIYDTALIGTEFVLDTDLIDRVEIVRGPGSSVYGSNALFAVVNVITRSGRDFDGTEASAELASAASNGQRLSYGGRNDDGAEWLLSGSRYRSKGHDLYFPEFDSPQTHNGIAQDLDGDRYEHLFGKASVLGLAMSGGYSRRVKQVPTASFGTAFNDPRYSTADETEFLDLGYPGAAVGPWTLAPRASYGRYYYAGDFPLGDPAVINKDKGIAEWWGLAADATRQWANQKLLAGLEYQDNFRQDQVNYDESPYTLYLDDERRSRRYGLYLEDELALPRGLLVNAGLRYDHYSTSGGATSPRLALIWNATGDTQLKLLHGTAFRAPNSYELYYSATPNRGNPDLRAEKIVTYEFIAEHRWSPQVLLTADFYDNRIRNLIDQMVDPTDGQLVHQNVGRSTARGAEFEAQCAWDDGTQLRTSYSWQIARDQDNGQELTNSPRHLSKFNLSHTVPGVPVRAGPELQYTGPRKTLAGGRTGGFVVANLTLVGTVPVAGLELSASAYNLFDRRYADPGRPEHVQDAITQDGRNFRLKLSYRW